MAGTPDSSSSNDPAKRAHSLGYWEGPIPAAPHNGGARDEFDGYDALGGDGAQRRPRTGRGKGGRDKIALVLAGGGVTGVVYEIGALRAIDDMLVDRSVNDFDVYVGTSAGAMVSSFIANGFTPREVMGLLNHEHPELSGINVGHIFKTNVGEIVQRALRLPRILWNVSREVVANLGDVSLIDILWQIADVLPNGIYNGDALDRYMRSLLEGAGGTNSFAQLKKELYLVATHLDDGKRAVFGTGVNEEVPISRAVAASSAVPILYRPVQIYEKDYVDGGLHGAASLDLAIEAGAKLVVCINPMVPFDAAQARPNEHYIRKHGLQAVLNQSIRTFFHSSLRYHIKNLNMKYPDVDIILIQPGLDDHHMFSYNPMDYRGRLAVAEHGFESVSVGLLQNMHYYRSVLARHDIALHTGLVKAELEALRAHGHHGEERTAVIEETVGAAKAPTLSSALSRLEMNLERLNAAVGNRVVVGEQ
jgi:predicted acylesterase/phospholipase RssA